MFDPTPAAPHSEPDEQQVVQPNINQTKMKGDCAMNTNHKQLYGLGNVALVV